MPDCMPWAVEEVEGPIAEIVDCWELANAEGIRAVESNLSQVSTPSER